MADLAGEAEDHATVGMGDAVPQILCALAPNSLSCQGRIRALAEFVMPLELEADKRLAGGVVD